MQHLYCRLLFSLFFLVPAILFSQDLIIQPPIIVGGAVKVNTLDFFDITVMNFNPASEHSLDITVSYSNKCDGLLQPAILLSIPFLKLMESGKIEPEIITQYNNNWKFIDNSLSEAINQNGYFPIGCYEVCYRYIDLVEQIEAKVCIEFKIDNGLSFFLLTPFNESVVDDPFPIFSWTPYEISPEFSYRIVVTELYDGQTEIQAISVNTPLLAENNISSTFIQYPISSIPLWDCKNYAWHVDVLKGVDIVQSSEVWRFKTKCDETIDPKVVNSTYYFLTNDADNIPFNIVGDTLRFILNQPYQEISNFKTSILSLNTSSLIDVHPSLIDKGIALEDYKINTGENYCFIDIKKLGFIPGDQYKLLVTNQTDTYYLYFQYYKTQ